MVQLAFENRSLKLNSGVKLNWHASKLDRLLTNAESLDLDKGCVNI